MKEPRSIPAARPEVPFHLVSLLQGIPRWLVIVALLASAAGAAVGIVMGKSIEGTVTAAVSQALKAQRPLITNPGTPPTSPPGGTTTPWPRATFASLSADQTQFSASADVRNGDILDIEVPLVNQSNSNLITNLTLVKPITGATSPENDITFQVLGSGTLNDVVQIAPSVWKFTMDTGANGLAAGNTLGNDIRASTTTTQPALPATPQKIAVASFTGFVADVWGGSALTGGADAIKATGTLTFSANPANNRIVTIGSVVYTFKDTLSGTATATAVQVKIGATSAATRDNLVGAIMGATTGGQAAGTTYQTGATAHPAVTAAAGTGAGVTLVATAITDGAAGNSIVTADDSADLTWSAATLTGGVDAIKATGTLTFTDNPNNNDTITIGSTVYTYKATLSTTPATPAAVGVKVGLTAAASRDNLVGAINAASGDGITSGPGITYQTGATAHPSVSATAPVGIPVTMVATANTAGAVGNSITTLTAPANGVIVIDVDDLQEIRTITAVDGGTNQFTLNSPLSFAHTSGVRVQSGDDSIIIRVTVGSLVVPGFYAISGTIKPVAL